MLKLAVPLTITASLLALTSCVGGAGSDGLTAGRSFQQNVGIHDGAPAPENSPIRKSTVRLQININGEIYRCSGSVLAKDLVLTAAHCLTTEEHGIGEALAPSAVIVIDDAGHRIQAKALQVHPGYFARSKNARYPFLQPGYDIGLVSLQSSLPQAEPVVFGDEVDEALSHQAAHPLMVAGFGLNAGQTCAQLEDVVRAGKIEIDAKFNVHGLEIFHDGVKRVLQTFAVNSGHARILEFSKLPGTAGVCRGDSGGPIYFEKGGRVHLIGVSSSIDPSAAVCTEITGQPQQAVAIAADALYFIIDSAKKISAEAATIGAAAGESAIRAETDNPSTFAYYFAHEEASEKNADLDLSKQVLIFSSSRSKNFNSAFLLPANVFGGHCTSGGLSAMTFDRALSAESDLAPYALSLPRQKAGSTEVFAIFEARVKKLNLDYRIVVLTPSGYVAKTFAVKDVCEF